MALMSPKLYKRIDLYIVNPDITEISPGSSTKLIDKTSFIAFPAP